MNDKARMTKHEKFPEQFALGVNTFPSFVLRICFVIRHSSFVIL
jgi:hypothetical protein